MIIARKLAKYPNFYDICPKNLTKFRILRDFCPKNARILYNNCPKIFVPNFGALVPRLLSRLLSRLLQRLLEIK